MSLGIKILIGIVVLILLGFGVVQYFGWKSQKDIEMYEYSLVKSYPEFEVRRYEPTLFTSVTLPSSEYKESSGKGFSILAGYIFGGNEKNEKIAMTSPVSMSMEDSMTMMFMVPKEYDQSTLPKPNQKAIKFVEVPAKTMAAIRFGGWANDEKLAEHKAKLLAELEKEGIQHGGKFYYFGYNAPFEFFNRRNEVLIELE